MPDQITAVPIPPNGKIDLPDSVAYSHPVEAVHVVRILATDAFTRKLIPEYINRCVGFIERGGFDTDPLWLINLIAANFFQNTNYTHCLVALNEHEKIVAHSFSYLDNNSIYILQAEKDLGGPDIVRLALRLVEEWAKTLGVKTLLNTSEGKSRPRLYERYGFKPHRSIMKKEVE